MTYTIAQLTTLYTNLHLGLAPTPLDALKIQGWASQNATGGLTDAGTLAALVGTGDMDVAVAVAAYQYFTGSTPSQAGLTYLVYSAANSQDLNDAYYNAFNLENRYINFTFNLGLFGAGAADFASAYGSLSFAQAVDAAYEKIIGSSFATAAGISPSFAKANIVSRQAYFVAIANANLAGQSQAMKDLGAKAGMIGYIMAEAMKADIGVYAVGVNAFMTDLALDGTAQHAVDLVTAYSIPASAINLAKTLQLTSGIDSGATFTLGAGDDTFQADLNASNQQTLNNGDSIDGGGGTDTINVTLKSTVTPASLANIEVFNVTNVDDGNGGTSPNLNLLNAGAVTTVKVNTVSDAQGIQVTNIQNAISKFEIANTAASVTFQVKAAALAGTSDAAVVTLDAVTAGTLTVTSGAASSGYETLTLKSAGSNPNVLDAVTDGASDQWKTLKITGDTDLTITSGLADKVSTVDATGFAGKLNLGIANTEVVTLTGGSGDDVFFFATGYVGGSGATADQINGGMGTDTLQLSGAQALAQTTAQANLTSIERLVISNNLTANFDTTLFTGISDIVFNAALTGGPTVTIDSGDQLTFKASFATTTLAVTGLGLTDTAKVKLGAGVNIGGLTTNGVESLSVEVDAGGNTLSGLVMTPTAASESLKITGAGKLSLSGVITADTIDASGLAAGGSLYMASGVSVAVAVTGSAGDDQLIGSGGDDIIVAGAGDDLVSGANGVDIIDLTGGGKDTVYQVGVYQTVNRDLITGFTAGTGAGADIFYLTASYSTAPTAVNNAPAVQVVASAPAAPVVFATAANDVLEFSFDLAGSGGANDLDNFTDGTGLLASLGQTLSGSAAGHVGYLIAYQGGAAYLYIAVDYNSNTTLAASEIDLIGVFTNVAVGAFEASNFVMG